MLIQNINRTDTGIYAFHAVWRNFIINTTMKLQVSYGPDVPSISPSYSYYCAGQTIILSCHADSNPPAKYSWKINRRPPIFSKELFSPSASVSNSGFYICHVYNLVTNLYSYTVKIITVYGFYGT
ncbi:carcinoembryonic antigen-related cell adhesion molecule 6-like [Erinaceus europaeus]|uniref:Carcinoembryonic antigen-related cell adhesion molecule 6-like n=1 Tax=Erinaceus europaeus TaxID=9365 RepID=A0ABM3WZP8_ERIEU|nr:carcinoembryonic antigen-related cell adhesion molecule 6-like [Erinaceus europaeus]